MTPTAMMFAPMEDSSTSRRRARSAVAATLALAALPFLASAAPVGQESATPDQVFRLNARTGKVTKLLGMVTENTLTSVKLIRDGKEQSLDGAEVVDVVWGTVPADYRDGRTYAERGDWENAVARFRVAAEDGETRDVVRAGARLESAEALLAWGATDPNRFVECASECERFLADFAADRGVPRAEWVRARATWLAGKAKEASELFKALYEKGAGSTPTTGYDRATCLEAGLAAAHSALAGGDAVTARTLFPTLESAFRDAASTIAGEDALARARLLRRAGEASVGEGFCMLAAAQGRDAREYFERKLQGSPEPGVRAAATLGLAEAHRTLGEMRAAQVAFAQVAALEFSDPDRLARALVGLAQVTLELGGSEASLEAKNWLATVMDTYGGTPWAATASELLKKL